MVKTFLPHSSLDRKVFGLKSSEPPPPTYKKYQLQPDGTVVFVGEFPTPKPRASFNKLNWDGYND